MKCDKMKWREYEIKLTPANSLKALMAEENKVVLSLLPVFAGYDVFWSGYFGPEYHNLRWGVKSVEDKYVLLRTTLPNHEIDCYDPLQETWAHDEEMYNSVSDIKAQACLVAVGGFDLNKLYSWDEMGLFIHFLLNALGYPYAEEALICSRNTYQSLLQNNKVLNSHG